MYDFLIVGGGLVGFATAHALLRRSPHSRLLLIEAELHPARHQSGRNSGVLHSGIYYRSGSFKARCCAEGRGLMLDFCRTQGIPHRLGGKLIIATRPEQIPGLDELQRRGEAQGLAVRRLTGSQIKKIEPAAGGLSALHVPEAGVINYRQVCRRLQNLVLEADGQVMLGTRLLRAYERTDYVQVITTNGEFSARTLINCAGLYSDVVAQRCGHQSSARIVPFRGEYFTLAPEKAALVRNLIYPVPLPDLPFLGVHLTRGIDDTVHCGPNAILALARCGYRRTDAHLSELSHILAFPGFWRLAGRFWKIGSHEILRSLSRSLFARDLSELVPGITPDDLYPTKSGIRAQALLPDGTLADDFIVERGPRSVHVINAPSPGATASLAIGRYIADMVGGNSARPAP